MQNTLSPPLQTRFANLDRWIEPRQIPALPSYASSAQFPHLQPFLIDLAEWANKHGKNGALHQST